MAKNVDNLTAQNNTGIDLYAEQVYEGSFKGDLIGNADTATSLKQAFTVTLAGDATGSFSTAGTNANLNVKVNRSTYADSAAHADSAASAATASTASHASTADHAVSADTATSAATAGLADHAVQADSASKAAQADYAQGAAEASHAVTADTAANAEKAKFADAAAVAKALENPDTPVAEAEHAQTAEIAKIAQYDCEGYSIKDYYAKKKEVVLKENAFTQAQAEALFIPRSEQVRFVQVSGKAFGTGYANGNTLNINIKELAVSGNGENIYGDLVFLNTPDLPAITDTTKIYINSDKLLYIYDADAAEWVNVSASISKETQLQVEQAIAQLQNYVDLTSAQSIQGEKTFKDAVFAPIPSLNDDPDRAVAVLHTVRDVYGKLSSNLTEMRIALQAQVTELSARVDAQQSGDVLFAYKDYSQLTNQKDMVVGTTYISLLAEDKTYIELDPEDNQPVDDSAVPFYWRYYRKDSKGNVTWTDYKINSATFLEYARLDGADFTGVITVPAADDPFSVMDNTVLGAFDVLQVIDRKISDNTDALNLEQYMPKTGGAFTGAVTVPDVVSWESADAGTAVNKKAVDDHELKVFIQADLPEILRNNSLYILV